MAKSLTLKDLSFYDREIEQVNHQLFDEIPETSPDPLIINHILAYAHALYVVNTKYIGPVSILIN
ncbi:MAG: hypothetical protein ACOYMF_11080 [Bacteroidales bacterium]